MVSVPFLVLHALIVTREHLFIVSTAAPLSQTVSKFLVPPSISAGLGVVYRFEPIRVEVNFAVPLVAARSDGLQRGFQVGVGLEFM